MLVINKMLVLIFVLSFQTASKRISDHQIYNKFPRKDPHYPIGYQHPRIVFGYDRTLLHVILNPSLLLKKNNSLTQFIVIRFLTL